MRQGIRFATWMCMVLGAGILLSECARKEQVLAEMGAARLTEEGLFRLAEALLEEQGDLLDEGKIRHALDVWVDKELMIFEARSRGLDTTDAVAGRLANERLKKLLHLYKLRYITPKVQLSERDIREYAKEHGYDRKLQPRRIITLTQEDADAAWAELQMGKPFEEVVQKWSVDEETKDKGGLIEGFFRKDQVFPPVAEVAFGKKVGELFGPIRTPLGYEIAQIVAEQPVPLEEMKEAVGKGKELWNEQFRIHSLAAAEELAERFGLKPRSEGIHLLIERGTGISGAERATPLYEYDRGGITVGDLLNALQNAQWRGPLKDSTQVVTLAWQLMVPTALFLEDAHRMGIHQEQAFLDWARKREEELLVEALRQREVKDKTKITEEEMREEYIAHLDRYSHRAEVWIQEVLLGTEEEAQRIRGQIEKGEDLEKLARTHSLREKARRTGGTFRFLDVDAGKYEGLVTAAFEAQVGELVGPIRAKDGYSVFRVLDKKDRRPKSLDEARSQVTARLRLRKEEERFGGLLEELRARYSERIVVHEEAVQALVKQFASA